jgi:hypothetical protein
MKSKSGEFGFIWIFAIVAGAAILLLMIYGAVGLLDNSRVLGDTRLAAELSIKLDPLEAGSLAGKGGILEASKPTRISIDCFEAGYGDNKIQISTQSNNGGEEWSIGNEITVKDKYIFSDALTEGEKFNIVSKQFSYPYKIADIIIITPNKYCFKDAPQKIKSAYRGLAGIDVDNCTAGETRICFDSGGCEVIVEGKCLGINCETKYDYGLIRKNGTSVAYADTLLMAAIVSDLDNYNCNVKRLMFRSSTIADLLIRKSNLASTRGCHTIIDQQLAVLKNSFLNYRPQNFLSDTDGILQVNKQNGAEACGLW